MDKNVGDHEVWGRWRLFTKSDLANSNIDSEQFGHVWGPLSRAVQDLRFEHGKEGKLPRANRWRPYRLTIGGSIAAFLVLRASEAYNTCEIDVFEVTEPEGLERGETTKAALLFALCDAVKSGGSLALQFRKRVAEGGLPESVVSLAEQCDTELSMGQRGTISPQEARTMFLAMAIPSPEARARVRELTDRRLVSTERICYLVATGIWDTIEAELILASSAYPETIFGSFFDLRGRQLIGQALGHLCAAAMASLFDRAVRLHVPDGSESEIPIDGANFHDLRIACSGEAGAVIYGSMPAVELYGWQAPEGDPLVVPANDSMIVAPRPRSREAIRAFLANDLRELADWKASLDVDIGVLLVSADFLSLTPHELDRAAYTAEELGILIQVCPLSLGRLESRALSKLAEGKRIRS